MNVLIAGATGLVGGHLIEELSQDKCIENIFVLSRRPFISQNDKVKVILTDFDNLDATLKQIEDVEAVYSCLGTTKAQTPDRSVYEKVEIHYPLQIAKWARENCVSQFHYISSIGTSLDAKNEYLSRKAVAEQQLSHTGIPQVFIYRPSFIVGKRERPRLLETIGGLVLKAAQPLLNGKARKYRPIEAKDIAHTMWLLTNKLEPGTYILESDEIFDISTGKATRNHTC